MAIDDRKLSDDMERAAESARRDYDLHGGDYNDGRADALYEYVDRVAELEAENERLRLEREPSQAEGDAADTDGDGGECFVTGWTGRRCRHCGRWVWGGPTACVQCANDAERVASLESENARLRAENESVDEDMGEVYRKAIAELYAREVVDRWLQRSYYREVYWYQGRLRAHERFSFHVYDCENYQDLAAKLREVDGG